MQWRDAYCYMESEEKGHAEKKTAVWCGRVTNSYLVDERRNSFTPDSHFSTVDVITILFECHTSDYNSCNRPQQWALCYMVGARGGI